MSKPICLTLGCAPGDIACLTAVPRDLHLSYPDRYEVHVATHCKTLWKHNPHVAGIHPRGKVPKGIEPLAMNYEWYIPQANKHQLHFVTAFHRRFKRITKLDLPCLHAKGDLHLKDEHKQAAPVDGRYWIVVAGGKTDFTTKVWSSQRWQKVIYALRDRGLQVVQCGADHRGNHHPALDGTIDLVGKTSLRDVLWLIQHADGVICPITCFMHFAAALNRPCVTIAGGREHWWWEAYVNVEGVEHFGPYSAPVTVPHRFLHTQGLLDCCKKRGCWKNKLLASERDKHRSHCKQPTEDGYGQPVPKCLELIDVDTVVNAALSYYRDNTLQPV